MARAFDLRQLRYFVAVAEAGSFRAAAERLHVSQPPLRRQVQDFERALGARLLDRRPSGVALTPDGRKALARAHAILRQVEDLAGAFSPKGGETRTALRIGITLAVTVANRTRMARAWRNKLPGTVIEVDAGFSRDLIPALKEGRLNFGLVGLPGEVTGLEVADVQVSPLVAALPARHRLAKRKRVSLLDVNDLPLFWLPRSNNPGYYDHCLRQFRALGYRPELIVVEPGQVQTLERIAQGEGWTMLNGAMLETRVPGIAYRPLAEGEILAIRIVAAWRPGQDEDRCRLLAETAAGVLRAAPARRRKTDSPD